MQGIGTNQESLKDTGSDPGVSRELAVTLRVSKMSEAIPRVLKKPAAILKNLKKSKMIPRASRRRK